MATVMLQWQRRAAATETGWLTKPRHNWALYTKRFAGPCGKAPTAATTEVLFILFFGY